MKTPNSLFLLIVPAVVFAAGCNRETPTEVLASIRPAGDDWVVTGALLIDAHGEPTSSSGDARTLEERLITLPSSWSEVRAAAAQARSDYEGQCPAGVEPYDVHHLSDEQFERLILTPGQPCDSPHEPDAGMPDPIVDAGNNDLVDVN